MIQNSKFNNYKLKMRNSKYQIPKNNNKLKFGQRDHKKYKLSIPGNVIY